MRRLLCAVFVLSLFVAVAAAQDVPKVEVFGGYALERVGFPEMNASDFEDIWYEFGIYPDSFAEFRRLQKFGHEHGFMVAGRPLPEGVPIMGSPNGTKSSAQ